MLTEKEVAAIDGRLVECPLCGCKEHEDYELCFHCMGCGYLQCCDWDGFYDRQREKDNGQSSS